MQNRVIRKFQKGMTLVEVLIALSVFTLSVLSGLQIMSFLNSRIIEDEERLLAQLVVDDILTEVQLGFIASRNQTNKRIIAGHEMEWVLTVDAITYKNIQIINLIIKNNNKVIANKTTALPNDIAVTRQAVLN